MTAREDLPPLPMAQSRSGGAALWYAFFGGAATWFAALCASWFLVTPACNTRTELFIHLVYFAAAIASLAASLTGAILWRRSSRWPDDGGTRKHRTAFLAATGALLSGLFTLVIAMQWLGAILHDPCTPAPRLPDSPDAMVQPDQLRGWPDVRVRLLPAA